MTSADSADSPRARAVAETRQRILETALEVLGENPEAGMADIARAAGVVRRTVYGHFPARQDLIRTLTQQAVEEITAVLGDADAPGKAPEAVWVDFFAELWPLTRRFRVLLALRRGEFGEEIHALLAPVDAGLAALVQRGQDGGAFGEHLPAGLLSQIAYTAIFSVADSDLAARVDGVRAATITSLLILGVTPARAEALLSGAGLRARRSAR